MIIVNDFVAPYVGAWIETLPNGEVGKLQMSHPTWVRGLKQRTADKASFVLVAPYVGAWIETQEREELENDNKSHPTWVRGLKLLYPGALS